MNKFNFLFFVSILFSNVHLFADTLVSGTKAVYQVKTPAAVLTESYLLDRKRMCNILHKKELKVVGNIQDMAKGEMTEYFTVDGVYQTRVQKKYLNLSKDPCTIVILPYTFKKIYNTQQRVFYKHSTTPGDRWKKSRIVSVPGAQPMANYLLDIPGLSSSLKPSGKDRHMGMTCDVYNFQKAITVCVWKSDKPTPPSYLSLYSKIHGKIVADDTVTTLTDIQFSVAMNAEDVLPSAEALKLK